MPRAHQAAPRDPSQPQSFREREKAACKKDRENLPGGWDLLNSEAGRHKRKAAGGPSPQGDPVFINGPQSNPQKNYLS